MKKNLLLLPCLLLGFIILTTSVSAQNQPYFHEGFTNNPGSFNSSAPTDNASLAVTYETADSGTWAAYGIYRTTGSPCSGLEAGHLRSIKTAAGSGRIPWVATPVLGFGIREFHFIPGNGNNKTFTIQKTSDTSAMTTNWTLVATFVAENCGGTTPDTTILINDASAKRVRVMSQENYQIDFDSVWVTSYTAILPIKFTSINAVETSGMVKLSWNIASEENVSRYVVQRSSDGIAYNDIATLSATGAGTYNYLDNSPVSGSNTYRVKAIDKDGAASLTSSVKIVLGKKLRELLISPNPVVGQVLNLQLNNFDKGTYSLNVYNRQGQRVYASTINNSGGSSTQSIQLPNTVKAGAYTLQLINGTDVTNKNIIVIQ